MKSLIKFTGCVLLIGIIINLSCQKELSCYECKVNKPPIAKAGNDTSIILPADSIILDGSKSSDPDDGIASYEWKKISGPDTFNIINSSAVKTAVNKLVKATYGFELTVTDKGGLSAKDTMQVIVYPAGTTNRPPIAHAGNDTTIVLPVNAVTLDGSGSSDPDNNITNYAWTKISGPASFNIINPNLVQTQVINLIEGVYQFELKVTDADGLFSMDTIQITVDKQWMNQPPVANAGKDTTIVLPVNSVTLDGSGSFDPDNNISNYLWTKISGPASFNITNANGIQTQVINLVQGVYQFELKVTDAAGLFSKDTVQIVVNPSPPDPCALGRPFVNAQLIPIGTLSIPRLEMSSASAGNKLLFAGGLETTHYNSIGGQAFKRVDIYDIVTQNWSTAELSLDRAEMGIAVAGNKIYFAGGLDQNDTWLATHYNRIDIYDASTGNWTIDSLSWPRVSTGGEVISNKIFFGGGWDRYYGNTDHAKVVDIKNLSTNTWSSTSLSETKAYSSSETMGNKFYFAGGAHGYYYTTISNRIDVYDNTTASWSTETMLEPKSHFASIGFAGKIYWAGGLTGSSRATAHMSALVEIKDIATNITAQACLFQPNARFSAVLRNNKFIFFTGDGAAKNKFDIYDLATNAWSIGVLPVEIYRASIISVNNTIYVAGGEVNGVLSNRVWKLDF